MTRVRCAFCGKRAGTGGIVYDGAYFCDDECYRTACGTLDDDACPSCGHALSDHLAGDCPGPSIA